MCSTNIILHRDCDDMNRKWVIMKALVTIFTIIFCILLVYMIVDFGGDAKDILSMYKVVDGSKDEFPKQLQFMKEYIRVTGDISIALNTGLTPEEVEYIMGDEDSGWSPGGGSGGGSGEGNSGNFDSNFTSLSLSEQLNKLKENEGFNNIHYKKMLNKVTIDNHDFAYETQSDSEGGWTSFKPSDYTMGKAGCFYYASAALVGAIKGQVYTVEQVLKDLGCNVTWDSNGVFKVNNNRNVSSLAGSPTKLNQILTAAGTGKSATAVPSIDPSKLANGTMYLIYATKETRSSTKLYSSSSRFGSHWTAVVGISDGQYIVLCNGKRGTLIDSSEFYNLKCIYEVK